MYLTFDFDHYEPGRLSAQKNVTNVTTLGVVFYQQQTSQRINDHQQQTSNHNKRHMVF